jgi:hypothetical protein
LQFLGARLEGDTKQSHTLQIGFPISVTIDSERQVMKELEIGYLENGQELPAIILLGVKEIPKSKTGAMWTLPYSPPEP